MDASPSTMASTFPSGKRPKAAQLSRCRVSAGGRGRRGREMGPRKFQGNLANIISFGQISDATLILEGIKLDDLEYK